MAKRRVMVELRYTPEIARQASTSPAARLDVTTLPRISGVAFDPEYAPVRLPARRPRAPSGDPRDISSLIELDMAPERATYIVRAEIEEEQLEALRSHEAVAGVFSDPLVEPLVTCDTSIPVGDHHIVEDLLGVDQMLKCGMDGSGVLVAIVDGGVNMQYLKEKGKAPAFSANGSWAWKEGLTPGSIEVSHGTMVAFDACIAAPNCTILDIVLLGWRGSVKENFDGLLSDAVKAYGHLLEIMQAPLHIGQRRSLVVNNSWSLSLGDYPPGHESNYSHNLDHPFNTMVADLEMAGADIVFAAGNCGPECPSFLCQAGIPGANGHPKVLTVAGVDTNRARVGYSSIGPAGLHDLKPDICGYTHFTGSGVYNNCDGGTSAASPVVAGVVAAVRSKRPYHASDPATHPEAIRALLRSTAEDLGPSGFDYQHGYGVVNGVALSKKLCTVDWSIAHICKVKPWICHGIFQWPEIPGPGPVIRWYDVPGIPFHLPTVQPPRPGGVARPSAATDDHAHAHMLEWLVRHSGVSDEVELAFLLGVIHAQQIAWSAGSAGLHGGRDIGA